MNEGMGGQGQPAGMGGQAQVQGMSGQSSPLHRNRDTLLQDYAREFKDEFEQD